MGSKANSSPKAAERINSNLFIGIEGLEDGNAFNGKGYPDGLAGEAIPWLVRITSVADVFDALVSDRPYRRSMSVQEASRIIYRGAGTQFDPRAVQAFAEILSDQSTMAALGLSHRAA